jgi:D-alanyl-D-alanine carboxypeptidase/D-alanyl-D-alanine-endopeptidase (penicillin-binding protein 4)
MLAHTRRRALAAAALLALASHGSAAPPARAEAPPPERAASRAQALEQAIDDIVANTALRSARVGMVVASLDTGEVLFARDPDALLNPASNVKLFTSAAALARLGPEYRFETEVLALPAPSRGVTKALYVRGKGDPTFVTERLWMLAGEIARAGVKSVRGDLVIDDGFFDDVREGPGYDQEDGDRAYLAPVGAVSLNFNTVEIHVGPGERPGDRGRVDVEPPSKYLDVVNRTLTAKRSRRRRIVPSSSRLDDGRQRIVVEGRIPAGSRDLVFRRKVDDPPLYFGLTLKRLLELRGVRVSGKVRRGATPEAARILVVSESESLGEIVHKLDKTSNNFIAEQILKTLGAEKRGVPGTWPKGVEAVEDFLAEIGIRRGSYVMKNGSGLNDANRFSARQTVTLLRQMWRRFPVMAEFVSALPVAGRDGTTRWRMEDTGGRVRAKTGTLENVTSLSGYVETAGHDRLVFSILVNDFAGRVRPVARGVDAVGTALAALGGPPAEMGAAIASATLPPPAAGEEAAAVVKARLALYRRLALAGDHRNVAFLRTALKAERDPVLRLAEAEAAYLSDPDSECCWREFLDVLSVEEGSIPRLRALAPPEPGGPVPVLGSLAELASEGSADALARLVEITPLALADPALVEPMAEIWEDVSRDVPDELLRALRAAPAPAADAALGSIARGVAMSKATDHPFADALQRARNDPDAPVAAYASAVGSRYEEQLTAARAVIRAGRPATIGPGPSSAAPAPAAGDRAVTATKAGG